MISLRPASEADAEFIFSALRASMRPYVEATWGTWDERWQRDHVCLARVFLLPRAQGRGIGSMLIRQVCEAAHRRGLPVVLTILKVNPARRLYERLGFTVVGETATHLRMESRPAAQ